MSRQGGEVWSRPPWQISTPIPTKGQIIPLTLLIHPQPNFQTFLWACNEICKIEQKWLKLLDHKRMEFHPANAFYWRLSYRIARYTRLHINFQEICHPERYFSCNKWKKITLPTVFLPTLTVYLSLPSSSCSTLIPGRQKGWLFELISLWPTAKKHRYSKVPNISANFLFYMEVLSSYAFPPTCPFIST